MAAAQRVARCRPAHQPRRRARRPRHHLGWSGPAEPPLTHLSSSELITDAYVYRRDHGLDTPFISSPRTWNSPARGGWAATPGIAGRIGGSLTARQAAPLD